MFEKKNIFEKIIFEKIKCLEQRLVGKQIMFEKKKEIMPREHLCIEAKIIRNCLKFPNLSLKEFIGPPIQR